MAVYFFDLPAQSVHFNCFIHDLIQSQLRLIGEITEEVEESFLCIAGAAMPYHNQPSIHRLRVFHWMWVEANLHPFDSTSEMFAGALGSQTPIQFHRFGHLHKVLFAAIYSQTSSAHGAYNIVHASDLQKLQPTP